MSQPLLDSTSDPVSPIHRGMGPQLLSPAEKKILPAFGHPSERLPTSLARVAAAGVKRDPLIEPRQHHHNAPPELFVKVGPLAPSAEGGPSSSSPPTKSPTSAVGGPSAPAPPLVHTQPAIPNFEITMPACPPPSSSSSAPNLAAHSPAAQMPGVQEQSLEAQRRPPQFDYAQRDRIEAHARSAALESCNYDWIVLIDLARLASQHQLSPYSVMKFGVKGSPYAYIPITMQQPASVEQILNRQRESEKRAAQWLLYKRRRIQEASQSRLSQSLSPESAQGTATCSDGSTASCGTKRPASVTPSSEARATSLLRTGEKDESPTGPEDEAKEGSKRSLNSVSTRAAGSPSPNPTDVDLQKFERSTRMEGDSAQRTESTEGGSQGSSSSGAVPTVGAQEEESAKTQQERERDWHASVAASVAPPAQQQGGVAVKTSDTHPIHISFLIPPNLIQQVSDAILPSARSSFPQLMRDGSSGRRSASTADRASNEREDLLSFADADSHSSDQVKGKRLTMLENVFDLASIVAPSHPSSSTTTLHQSQSQIAEAAMAEGPPIQSTERENGGGGGGGGYDDDDDGCKLRQPTRIIGNLLLSSCPGKKVRLTGPVRGRGAICRDLGMDLKRIKELGVGAIVCCLDDEELDFLGAPWSEYEREADSLGIDVIRIPMAEGFSPTCVAGTDAVMTHVVTEYTLNGTSVLVHCRGGVGRAGLVACTWLLKMGLVGSTELIGVNPPDPNIREQDLFSEAGLKILQVVERLIDLIRRRRSPKAIETAEQVKFIVEYAIYLHRQESSRKGRIPSTSLTAPP